MGPFEVGDVVVCVDADPHLEWAEYWHDANYTEGLLTEGRSYRAADVTQSVHGYWGVDVRVPTPDGTMFWDASRFRKIEAPKTEIADRIRACKPVPVTV